MKVTFNAYSADDIIQEYINFIKKRNSKEVFIKYFSDKYGLRVTIVGKLTIDDRRLKELPKYIQYNKTNHNLKLFQKDWKIKFQLLLLKDSENSYIDKVELSFDKSLKKDVYKHFKEFELEEIK